MNIPTRRVTINIARDLVDGKIKPKEVAEWAQRLYNPENRAVLEKLEHDDPLLEEFISTLGMADLPGSGEAKLYGVQDFQDWLDEFLQKIGENNSNNSKQF